MITLQKDALRGSIPPIVTPFRNGKVDYDRLASLIDFQARNGTHGVLINGTTSEPSTLTLEERNQAVTVAVEAARGRLQVCLLYTSWPTGRDHRGVRAGQ